MEKTKESLNVRMPVFIRFSLSQFLGYFLLACVFQILAFGKDALAEDKMRSVSVSGSCIRTVVPDRGAVVLTVVAKNESSKRAQAEAHQQYEGLRSKVAQLKLADPEITTVEYRSEEIREWEKGKSVSKGFQTRMGLRVETSDHGRLGEALDLARREGVKEVGSLELFVSSRKVLKERMACLKEAAEHAKAKADALAQSLGAKVAEVHSIVEHHSPDHPQPYAPMRMAKAMSAEAGLADAGSSPQLEAGKLELTTNVQVVFGLK